LDSVLKQAFASTSGWGAGNMHPDSRLQINIIEVANQY
jgi:hypothetical protein